MIPSPACGRGQGEGKPLSGAARLRERVGVRVYLRSLSVSGGSVSPRLRVVVLAKLIVELSSAKNAFRAVPGGTSPSVTSNGCAIAGGIFVRANVPRCSSIRNEKIAF